MLTKKKFFIELFDIIEFILNLYGFYYLFE